MPPHFPAMVLAELRAVFGRWSARGALILAVVVALLCVAGLDLVRDQAVDAQVNNMPIQSIVDMTWRGAVAWTLKARNFFVLPMLLVLATAASVSGELADHTLREALVRPVNRWAVLAAKLIALMVLSAATLLASLVPAVLGGAATFGTEGDLGPVMLGFLASWGSDLGLLVMTMALAVFVRNVGGVVVAVVMFLMADWVARLLLGLVGMIGLQAASRFADVLPGAALACWEGWSDGWQWEPFAGLVALIAVSLAVALTRFQSMDVP